MKSFSFQDRQEAVAELQKGRDEFDLVIIGGGIVGAGVARDAASRGMSVLLIEARDFAFGTSSRSSKLIHGGIRYLEHLEFALVFEALSERQVLFEIAPHLVHPLRFVLPVFDDSRVGMFKMGCGMWLYDFLARFRGGAHERLERYATLQRVPSLKEKGLVGSYVYSDAYMDDDRLVLETLRSANEFGAVCLNYVEAGAPEFEDGKLSRLGCRDRLGGGEWKVKAKHFLSTVGPWTDLFGHKIFSEWKNILKPSKGIHLTLPRGRLPLKDAVVMADDVNERIVFGIPRHEMVIVGTTDTPFSGDPEDVRANEEDVRYLHRMVTEYFPKADLHRSDYLASYAGVRPLVKSDEASVGKTSREHAILSDPRGITFVAGGKYTTYRRMAEDIVDHTLRFFGTRDLARFGRSQTRQPINAGCSFEELQRSRQSVEVWAREAGVDRGILELLWSRYGGEVETILHRYGETLGLSGGYWRVEAEKAIDDTMCLSLVDFYTRRTPLFLAEPDQGLGSLDEIGQVFARRHGWSERQAAEQKAAVKDHIRTELAWKLS